MRKYRRKIESWSKKINEETDETSKTFNNKNWLKFQGGGPLILESQMPKFIDAVKQIIPKLPVKNFESLRDQVLPVIKKLRSERGKEPKENIFSNHFWSYIREKQPELEEIWSSSSQFKPQEPDSWMTTCLHQEEELKCEFITGKRESFLMNSPSTNISDASAMHIEEDEMRASQTMFSNLKQDQEDDEDDKYSIYNVKVGIFEEFLKRIGLSESNHPQD